MKHVKGVITGDWHLRKDSPQARPENEEAWGDFQFRQLCDLLDYCKDNDLPILQTGDLFNKSQPYYGIGGRLRYVMRSFTDFYRLAGNHDLPYLSYDNVWNSGWDAAPGTPIDQEYKGAFHFGTEPEKCKAKIMFLHQLIFPDEKSRPPGDVGKTASELLAEYPNAKWIFTGDYHKNFHYVEDARHVVNPGCLNRQKASEINYRCGFYVVDTEEETVEFVQLEDNVQMDTEYIDVIKERDDRLEAFMEKISSTEKVTFNFSDNLKKKLSKKSVRLGIKNIVIEIQEEIGIGVKK